MNSFPPEDCWAKTDSAGEPGLSVRDHCINVGAIAQVLLARGTLAGISRPWAVWLAACHDIGKVSPGFQQKCLSWLIRNGLQDVSRKIEWRYAEGDHSKVSQYTLQYVIRERVNLGKEDAALWAAVSGMHHGEPHYRGLWNESGGKQDDWDKQRRVFARELAQLFGPLEASGPSVHSNAALFWTAGLISVADWIGSGEQFFPVEHNAVKMKFEDALQRASKASVEIGFEAIAVTPNLIFSELFGFSPNDLQRVAMDTITRPGVYVIEAPMGMGKTEAALAVAYHLISNGQASGLYFALPTQATSNRIHLRVTDFLRRIQTQVPRLIHSGSWLLDDSLRFPDLKARQPNDQSRTNRDWFASSKRALLSPFGVGTVDQALMGVIAVKHFFVRYYALAGKVVVLDEVHSYDVFTGTLIEALIEALSSLGCTIIILSATLTRERREALLGKAMPPPPLTSPGQRKAPLSAQPSCASPASPEPFPLITGIVDGEAIQPRMVGLSVTRPDVVLRFRNETEILSQAVAAARAGACVLWICNTVDRAQANYLAICNERCEGDPPIGLLHSRFPFFRRAQLEEVWMQALGKDRAARPPGCLLVSTQIVEQSVDLDTDLLISELAPTDMLFQRMGRLWRHWSEKDKPRPLAKPEVWIVEEPKSFHELMQADERLIRETLGKKARVYSPYVLLRTLEQWHDQTEVRLPMDIRPWLERTYAERGEDGRPSWKALKEKMLKKRDAHQNRAETAQNVWNLSALKDEEGIGTRLNECPTLPLILAKDASVRHLTLLDGTLIKVQANYFDYSIAKALHRNIIPAPAWFFPNKDRCLNHLPQQVPDMIKFHIKGQVELGILNGRNITAESLDAEARLEFHEHIGLTRKAGVRQPYNYDDCDESFD